MSAKSVSKICPNEGCSNEINLIKSDHWPSEIDLIECQECGTLFQRHLLIDDDDEIGDVEVPT